jgi:biopolymer transport protein ExbB
MINLFIKGGPVMYALLVCSIITTTVIIERVLFWIREDMHRNQAIVYNILELSRKGDWDAIRQQVVGSRDYVIRILIAGILHKDFSMTKAMESAAADQVKRMRRYLYILDTMVTIAPLLGIFGTVTGVMTSFEALGISGIERPFAVTAGIAEVLICTASGLAIAIPSVFFYNYFNSKTEAAVITIEKYATSLEIVYEKLVKESKGKGDGIHEG